MGVKAQLESLDNVPAELHSYYVETDGKFILDLEEDIKAHPRVTALSNAYRKEQERRKEAATKLAEAEAKLAEIPDGFDAEEYLALKAGAGDPNDPAKKKANDEHLQSQRQLYEQKIANLTKKFESDLAAKDAALGERDGYIDRTVAEAGLKDSLLEVGVDPDLLDGALATLKPSVKVQRHDDGSRKAIVETDVGEVEVKAFVKDWAQSKGKPYLGKPTGPDPKGNNGSGRGGVKTMSRAEFDKLDPAARVKAMTVDKVTITD